MILQWIYTYSCWNRKKKPSESLSRGFGTFSWTDGLSLQDIEELERRCSGYELPAWASSRPSPQERENLPVVFYSFRLASGKRALVRTQYIGEGFYDKRWGAVISHAMVLEEGDWAGYPIEWIDSPDFWKELPENIRNTAISYLDNPNRPDPDPLPPLSESMFRKSGNFSDERVLQYFQNEKNRELVARLLSFWNRCDGQSSFATFTGAEDDSVRLIAGFTMLFPEDQALELSFSTNLFSSLPSEEDRPRWYDVAFADSRKTRILLETIPIDGEASEYVSFATLDRAGLFDFVKGFSKTTVRDWRILFRLYSISRGKLQPGTSKWMAEEFDFLRSHGDKTVRNRCLSALLNNAGMIPSSLSRDWLNGLVSLCDGDSTVESIPVRMFLSNRDRLVVGEAVACFLDFLRRNVGTCRDIWLKEYAEKEKRTLDVCFTIAAVADGNADAQEANCKVKELLSHAGAIPDIKWQEILSFTTNRFPSVLAAVVSICPSDDTIQGFIANHIRDVDSAIRITRQMLAVGENNQAKRLLRLFLDTKAKEKNSAFIQLTDGLTITHEDFAKSVYMDLFLQARHTVSSEKEIAWYTGKIESGFVSEADKDTYWRMIDEKLPVKSKNPSGILSAIKSFLRLRPSTGGKTKADFMKWATDVSNGKDKSFSFEDLPLYGAVFSNLDNEARGLWLGRLLLPLYLKVSNGPEQQTDTVPTSVEQHLVILRFLTGGSTEREIRRTAERYASIAIDDMNNQKAKTHTIRFGGLVRVCLRPDSDPVVVAGIRHSLQRKVYAKYSPTEMANELTMRALSSLSTAENAGWRKFCDEIEAAKRNRGVVGRFFDFFKGLVQKS